MTRRDGHQTMIVHSPGEDRRHMNDAYLSELRFYGPFRDIDTAHEWARRTLPAREWRSITLRSPESYGRSDEE